MELSRRVLNAYNSAIKKQGNIAERTARTALSSWFADNPGASIAETREFCIALIREVATVCGSASGDAAYALRDAVASAAGVELPSADYVYTPEMEYVSKTVRYQVEKLKSGNVEGFIGQIAAAARYHSERGANDTMTHLGEADSKKHGKKVAFARVPTGPTTCPYCLMLASQGFVYGSELKALNANHRHCDCRIVEGFKGMKVEGYDPDECYDRWKNPEKYGERDFSHVRYGQYRGLSYIDDNLGQHVGDGSKLDPLEMVMKDTGFNKEEARQVLSDMYQWTGQGYTDIRKRNGEFSEVADRIERFITESPKYKGEVWRGIGIEHDAAQTLIDRLLGGEEVDQLGISSWATDIDWAHEFGSMNVERLEDGTKVIFHLADNKTGVSIKHIASSADNDEVIASESARYALNGKIEYLSDPYDGDYVLIPVREV